MSKLPPVNRRSFVRLVLAGGAGSLAGCVREQQQTIVSPVDRPEEMVPGRILEYATVCRACPAGCGLLVRTNEARATKLEGLPDHPVNHGALCARGHAELQRLYSPNRLREPLARGEDGVLRTAGWDEVLPRVAAALASGDTTAPFAVISRGLGPSMRDLLQRLCDAAGGQLYEHEPYPYAALRAASRIAFGHRGVWRPRLERARMVLSFGADFLETWLSPVAHARGYAQARRYHEGTIGLHTQVEPRLSLTGANADEWLAIRPGTEHVLALGLLRTILQERLDVGLDSDTRAALERLAAPYNTAVVEELTQIPEAEAVHLARSFALTRPALALPPGLASSGAAATAAHLATLLLNLAVGAIPEALEFVRSPLLERLATPADLDGLRSRLADGGIRLLILHDSNPLPALPDGPAWDAALEAAPLVVALASTLDETAARADIVLPISTPIESWDDFEPYAGVTGLQQPATRPLEGTRHAGDLLLDLAGRAGGAAAAALPWASFTELLRDRWAALQAKLAPDADFESFWQESLRQGGRWGPAETVSTVPTAELLAGAWLADAGAAAATEAAGGRDLELILTPSLHHFDGGREPAGWLQEVPDPLAQVAWSPWVELHPDAAQRLGIAQGDLVAVESPLGVVRAPALLNRWLLAEAVALPLGPRYGVRDGERVSPAQLVPARYEAVSGEAVWAGTRVAVRRLGPRNQLLTPRASADQGERPLAQTVAVAALRRGEARPEENEHRRGLYSEHEHPDHRWGMVIDTHACIGCNACTIACYAENNIPVVGREQMALGREMAWLRVEVYDEGDEAPDVRFLPMLCQQCDNAPCEPVCPVFATYHNPEGLNAQVYNRCVGTRYCSNNCPYKVRRFNWLQPQFPEPLNRQLNPNVTVRDAGVMEKCTFCVQRIQAAKFRADDEGRPLRDGDVVPACAQTCPTDAITFGDTNDPDSRVSAAVADARAYAVLEHLNTKPAVRYLKKITAGRSA